MLKPYSMVLKLNTKVRNLIIKVRLNSPNYDLLHGMYLAFTYAVLIMDDRKHQSYF